MLKAWHAKKTWAKAELTFFFSVTQAFNLYIGFAPPPAFVVLPRLAVQTLKTLF
jgi:hypothetical protein